MSASLVVLKLPIMLIIGTFEVDEVIFYGRRLVAQVVESSLIPRIIELLPFGLNPVVREFIESREVSRPEPDRDILP